MGCRSLVGIRLDLCHDQRMKPYWKFICELLPSESVPVVILPMRLTFGIGGSGGRDSDWSNIYGILPKQNN
jgi:hypothetical protein